MQKITSEVEEDRHEDAFLSSSTRKAETGESQVPDQPSDIEDPVLKILANSLECSSYWC